MATIFESILPVFLLVILGGFLKRAPVISSGFWEGLEQFGYYVLFPALLFITLYRADFSGFDIAGVTVVTLLALGFFCLFVLALWPLLRAGGISASSFTTVVQTATRWNAFVALAIAQKLFGAPGLGLVALVMAVIILPINLYSVSVMLRFGMGTRGFGKLAWHIIRNPIILGCIAGLAMRLSPWPLYEPIAATVELLSTPALPLGLLMVGAGLKLRDALVPRFIVLLPVLLKLVAFPVVMVSLALLFGVENQSIMILALCASVPTAMNGYLLARQMGGDAPLYAAVATVQTAVSFITMPLVLAVTSQLISG